MTDVDQSHPFRETIVYGLVARCFYFSVGPPPCPTNRGYQPSEAVPMRPPAGIPTPPICFAGRKEAAVWWIGRLGWWISSLRDCAAVMRRYPGSHRVCREGRGQEFGTIRPRSSSRAGFHVVGARISCCMTGAVPVRSGGGNSSRARREPSRCCVTWERVRVGTIQPMLGGNR